MRLHFMVSPKFLFIKDRHAMQDKKQTRWTGVKNEISSTRPAEMARYKKEIFKNMILVFIRRPKGT